MRPRTNDGVVLRAEGLSKKYTITVSTRSNPTLAERIHDGFTHLWKPSREKHQEIWPLQNASFEIRQGEVVGLIGRNGSGKTTLLKILSRITEPTRGRAEIHGRVATLLEVGTGFHPELTGRDNIFLSGTIQGMTKREIAARFDEIVAFSGIEKFIDTPVKRYSSGMYIRLAFAVGAHLESDVLLIDEVLAVGDGEFQAKCLTKMHDMGEQGRTVLLVSHDLSVITRLCHRAILLDKGRLIADGPTEEVVSTYLHSGGVRATSAKEWQNRAKAPGNDAVRFRAVRLRNDRMALTNVMDIGQAFNVELEYEVLQAGHILAPHFGLVNAKGDLLFLAYEVTSSWGNCPRKIGKYISQGIVPGHLLTEGTYFVSAFCRTIHTRAVNIELHEAIMFQVIESQDEHSARGNIDGHIPGLIRPLLQWRTRFQELPETMAQLQEVAQRREARRLFCK